MGRGDLDCRAWEGLGKTGEKDRRGQVVGWGEEAAEALGRP